MNELINVLEPFGVLKRACEDRDPVEMNRLELLPNELQNKIYYEAHKQMMSEVFEDVKDTCKRQENHFLGELHAQMSNELYNSDMSIIEIRTYFECMDCISGRANANYKNLQLNKYYGAYDYYWNLMDEQDYYSTPASLYIYGR